MTIKKRKQIHLKNFDYRDKSFVYFVTICAADKQSYFNDESIGKVVIDELIYRDKIKEIKLYCLCLMPNHLHVLVSLGENYGKSLNNWVSTFKRYTSKIARDGFNIKPLWQFNFYDHVVRKEESLIEIAEYILNNPVRKGLAVEWTEYPFAKLVDNIPV